MQNIVSIKKLSKIYDNNFQALNNITLDIKKNEIFTEKNIWVKRPGTGEIPALKYDKILKKRAKKNIPKNKQLSYSDIS